MQGDSPLSRFALIDSPLDDLSWDDSLTFTEIEGCVMVTFNPITQTVMVDNTGNVIEYIKTNPLNLEWISTIKVNQEKEDNKPVVIALLDSSKNEISGDELDHNEEEEEDEGDEAGKEELLGMSEDNLDPGFMLINTNIAARYSPSRTVDLEDQDFELQNTEELDQVDADINNIALTEQEGAKNPAVQAKKEDQADFAHVDWWITVLVRAVKLLSELSRCQSCCQSCW